ncbi:MAG: LPS export ABC transporter ATP-binding protein [Deferribacterota bacterium]|nr:LPS export ABC transporter ATP-binding protein [Deferribacterota bacterium]
MSLSAEDLCKVYKNNTVVNKINLSVKKGEIVGLLGPNGAGKTTTFYMLVGIIKSDSGKITFFDRNITNMPIYKRALLGLGYLPQEASIFRKLTAYENIYAVLELRYRDNKYIRERTEQLIADFDLEKVRNSKGYILSGGERRRVEIARTFSLNPEIILLDEPFTGVDPISIIEIKEMIFNLKKKNIGVLITDHNVKETLSITDRAYIIYNGAILAEGDPASLINHEKVIDYYLGKGFRL